MGWASVGTSGGEVAPCLSWGGILFWRVGHSKE